eukprot:scaffold1137_cov55-Cyclotella_meneghiniana.AAC.5
MTEAVLVGFVGVVGVATALTEACVADGDGTHFGGEICGRGGIVLIVIRDIHGFDGGLFRDDWCYGVGRSRDAAGRLLRLIRSPRFHRAARMLPRFIWNCLFLLRGG